MTNRSLRVYFDFIDPLSYFALLDWSPAAADERVDAVWVPFELRPPPVALVEVGDPSVSGRWEAAGRLAADRGVALSPPRLVPWTRKAHELVLHATDVGADAGALRRSLFEAYAIEGRDIGRVDVLVDLARAASMDTTTTKAVLDVDRFEADVVTLRSEALAAGVSDTPTAMMGRRRLEGFHNGTVLGTFLRTQDP